VSRVSLLEKVTLTLEDFVSAKTKNHNIMENTSTDDSLIKLYRFDRDKFGGIGVTASTNIPLGTLILIDPPILLVPDVEEESILQNILTAQVGPPGASRKKFNALVDVYANPPHKKTAKGIIRTNGYPTIGAFVPDMDIPAVGGIFPILSRFNSSCIPNVTHRYDPERNIQAVFAARAISEGEELLTCYVDPTTPSADRKAVLLERFKFECTCDACHGDSVDEHDLSRRRISSLDDEIFEKIRSGKYNLALDAINLRIKLLKDEQLDSPEALLRTYNDGYQCCDHSGDHLKALDYLRKVHEMQSMCDISKSKLEEIKNRLQALEEKAKCKA